VVLLIADYVGALAGQGALQQLHDCRGWSCRVALIPLLAGTADILPGRPVPSAVAVGFCTCSARTKPHYRSSEEEPS
jgi:hypothetical protein